MRAQAHTRTHARAHGPAPCATTAGMPRPVPPCPPRQAGPPVCPVRLSARPRLKKMARKVPLAPRGPVFFVPSLYMSSTAAHPAGARRRKSPGPTACTCSGGQSKHGVCRALRLGRKGVAGEGLGKGGGRGAPHMDLRARWRCREANRHPGCASTTPDGIAAGSSGQRHLPATPVPSAPAAGRSPRHPRFCGF